MVENRTTGQASKNLTNKENEGKEVFDAAIWFQEHRDSTSRVHGVGRREQSLPERAAEEVEPLGRAGLRESQGMKGISSVKRWSQESLKTHEWISREDRGMLGQEGDRGGCGKMFCLFDRCYCSLLDIVSAPLVVSWWDSSVLSYPGDLSLTSSIF